ncbi:MAG: hypothetical protein H6577_06845 [Lewinellaceae bacterium]|nr:hypothetical protein [Saprospiraceae bacterium]MCB9337827.1 hypothetical protein [Lewinellaceae bacterium]
MNNTQKRLSAAAWSMLESLSRQRKSVQKELDFLHSVSPEFASEKLESMLQSIDHFNGEISEFLSNMKEATDKYALEREFDDLNARFVLLNKLADTLMGK